MNMKWICTLFAALTIAFSAFAEDTARYLVVLRDTASLKSTDARITALGGHIVGTRMNRRLVELPPGAAEELSRNPGVAWLQKLSDGATLAAEAPERVVENYSATPDWTTGEYQFDGSGNIRTIGADQFAYDTATRLIRSTVNAQTQTYEYDAFGNQINAATGPIDSANHVSSRTYDVAGNIITDSHGRPYLYDSLGMITGLTAVDAPRRMIYTADDERIAVVVAPGLTDETWRIRVRNFGKQVLREFAKTPLGTEWVRDYVYAGGRLVAGERQVAAGQSGIRHFHLDHLGSVRLITRGGDAARITEPKYAPFGTEIRSSKDEALLGYTPLEPLKFTGHERDYTGLENVDDGEALDYMHARYYEAGLGRLLSVDPVLGTPGAPQSWNRYAYALNNPLKNIDPTGMEETAFHCDEKGDTCYYETTQPALEFDATDTAKDFARETATEVVMSMGFVETLAGIINEDGGQFAAGVLKQLSWAVPGGAASGTTRTLSAGDRLLMQLPDVAPELMYGARVEARALAEPGLYHNFPQMIDDVVTSTGQIEAVSGNYVQYTMGGAINGQTGVWEIGGRPLLNNILAVTHRFFRPIP